MINKQTIGYVICTVARKIHQRLAEEFKNYNITPEQWVVLKTLSSQEGISQKEIADKVEKDPNTIKAIVDKLDRKCLIQREQNPYDKRAFSIYLTQKGKELVQNLYSLDRKMLDNIVCELSDEDISNLDSILLKIEKSLLTK